MNNLKYASGETTIGSYIKAANKCEKEVREKWLKLFNLNKLKALSLQK